MLAQLEQAKAEFTAAGLQVVAVAMGQPKHAAQFCGSLAPSLRCLAHEDAAPYYAYGLSQANMGQLMGINVVKEGMEAATQGFVPGQVIGDPRMMPGTFIVDTQGIIVWRYYGKDVSDHPTNAELLRVGSSVTA
jgi:peroxiredoxin